MPFGREPEDPRDRGWLRRRENLPDKAESGDEVMRASEPPPNLAPPPPPGGAKRLYPPRAPLGGGGGKSV